MNITTATPLMGMPTATLEGASAAVDNSPHGLAPQNSGAPSPAPQPAPVTNEKLASMIEEANAKLRGGGNVQFAVHDGTNRVVVRLVDPQSMEVIREFPNTELLDVVSKLQELSGINVDTFS